MGLFLHKRAPLTEAELAQRKAAARASALARHKGWAIGGAAALVAGGVAGLLSHNGRIQQALAERAVKLLRETPGKTVYRGAPVLDFRTGARADRNAIYVTPRRTLADYYGHSDAVLPGSVMRYKLSPKARLLPVQDPATPAEQRLISRAAFRQSLTSGENFDFGLRNDAKPPPATWSEKRQLYHSLVHRGNADNNATADLIDRPNKSVVRLLRRHGYQGTENHDIKSIHDSTVLTPLYARSGRSRKISVTPINKRAPLTQAELAQRKVAAKASAEARHRAETTPSVKQGSSGAPSRQAAGLFRQGQARPDTRATRSAWDTRTTEAPIGAMNASFTFHLPKAYRAEKPDRPRLMPKAVATARAKAQEGVHQDVVITNPKALAEAHRHPQMRTIIQHAVQVVRDHQTGAIEKGTEQGLIPEGTRPGTVVRAYKHAALRALHRAGLGDYDTRMDEAAKAEFRPLVGFMRYAHRRVFDHLNQGQLKGKWQPFRDEYGQLFRQKKHGKLTGKERMRMRPVEEFIKIDLGNLDGDLLAKLSPAAEPSSRWTKYSIQHGFSSAGGAAETGGNPHGLARKAVIAHALGRSIPEPPGGLPPIHGARMKHQAQGVERHFGVPTIDVPKIQGSTQKLPNGLYRVVPLEDLEKIEVTLAKQDFGFSLGSNFTTDPKRQLARAIRPRMRRNHLRLRLNTQRNLHRVLNGGVTRAERWQLGAGSPMPVYKREPSTKPRGMAYISVNRQIIKTNKERGENHPPFAIYHGSRKASDAHEVHIAGPSQLVYRPSAPLRNGARVWIEAHRDHVQGHLAGASSGLPVFKMAKRLLTEDDVRQAARRARVPTKAQAEAGNYPMGHVAIGGLNVSIETPKGRIRRGVGPDGRKWQVTMPAHYGYLKGTEGADGDHVDCYLGPHAHRAHELPVHVVDQCDANTGAFDETKCMLGFPTKSAAVATYDAGFSDGRGADRRGAITTVPFAEFKQWVGSGDTTKPMKKGLGLGIAGAAAAGFAARGLARGLKARAIRRNAGKTFRNQMLDAKTALRDHLRTFEGGTPSPAGERAAHAAFRASKHSALNHIRVTRNAQLKNIRTSKRLVGAAAIGGGIAGWRSGGGERPIMPPLYQSAATPEDTQS
jgi:hypothetical protein